MAKQKDKNITHRWASKPVQKLIDEYTGASIYSDQIEYDYKGLYTRKGGADIQPPNELPIFYPETEIPDFVNVDGPNQLTLLAQFLELYWNTADIYWDDNPYSW